MDSLDSGPRAAVAAANDLRVGVFVRALAVLGSAALALFNPQLRVGRLGFACGLALWCAAAGAAYLSMDPIADCNWISDAALVRIAAVYGWGSTVWALGVTVLTVRRVHDWGISGAWALLLSVPIVNIALLAACLALPGREAGSSWATESSIFDGTL